MTYAKIIPIFSILTLLQSTLLSAFTVFGTMANFSLCFFILTIFLYEKEREYLIVGVVFAMISDVIISRNIGAYTLSILALGILIIFLKGFLNYESKISIIILGILGSVVTTVMTAILTAVLGSQLSWIRLIKFTGVESLLNILVMLIMYLIMIRGVNKRPKRSRYERYEII